MHDVNMATGLLGSRLEPEEATRCKLQEAHDALLAADAAARRHRVASKLSALRRAIPHKNSVLGKFACLLEDEPEAGDVGVSPQRRAEIARGKMTRSLLLQGCGGLRHRKQTQTLFGRAFVARRADEYRHAQRQQLWAALLAQTAATQRWRDALHFHRADRRVAEAAMELQRRWRVWKWRERRQALSPLRRLFLKLGHVVRFIARLQAGRAAKQRAANIIRCALEASRHPISRWLGLIRSMQRGVHTWQRMWRAYKLSTTTRMLLLTKVWDDLEARELKLNDSSRAVYLRHVLSASARNEKQPGIARARRVLAQAQASSAAQAPGRSGGNKDQYHSHRPPSARIARPRSALADRSKRLSLHLQEHRRGDTPTHHPQRPRTAQARARRAESPQRRPRTSQLKPSRPTSAWELLKGCALYGTQHGVIAAKTGSAVEGRHAPGDMEPTQLLRHPAKEAGLIPDSAEQRAVRTKLQLPTWLTSRQVVYTVDDSRRGKLVACGFTRMAVPSGMKQTLLRRYLTEKRREHARRLRTLREANAEYTRRHALSLNVHDARFVLQHPKAVVKRAMEHHFKTALATAHMSAPPLLILSQARRELPPIIRNAINAAMRVRTEHLKRRRSQQVPRRLSIPRAESGVFMKRGEITALVDHTGIVDSSPHATPPARRPSVQRTFTTAGKDLLASMQEQLPDSRWADGREVSQASTASSSRRSSQTSHIQVERGTAELRERVDNKRIQVAGVHAQHGLQSGASTKDLHASQVDALTRLSTVLKFAARCPGGQPPPSTPSLPSLVPKKPHAAQVHALASQRVRLFAPPPNRPAIPEQGDLRRALQAQQETLADMAGAILGSKTVQAFVPLAGESTRPESSKRRSCKKRRKPAPPPPRGLKSSTLPRPPVQPRQDNLPAIRHKLDA